jgi:copper chaperone CopZ
MEKLVLTIPTLYGDHHTSAVKEILEGLEGVGDLYVSSAFKQINVSFDKKKLSAKDIESKLADMGYSTEEFESAYPTSIKERETRHSAAVTGVGDSHAFAQTVSFEGRALWPCPGFNVQAPAENA